MPSSQKFDCPFPFLWMPSQFLGRKEYLSRHSKNYEVDIEF